MGPSNAGLADPGQCAALSLAQVSGALGVLQENLDPAPEAVLSRPFKPLPSAVSGSVEQCAPLKEA
jgi:hypothetical protein